MGLLDMGMGSNSSSMRRYNESVLLTMLRKQKTASKSDLARQTALTPQAIARIVDDLEGEGVVQRKGRRLGGKGQPSVLYTINPEGAYSIGVKVSRSSIEMRLIDFCGTLLEKIEFEADCAEPALMLDLIEKGIGELALKLSPRDFRKLVGVGITLPESICKGKKVQSLSDGYLRQRRDFSFVEELSERTDFPVSSKNSGSAAAVAELLFGHGIAISNFFYVLVDTVVDGALVLNGRLETRARDDFEGLASMPVPPSNLRSTPPVEGQFELLCNRVSLFGLYRHLKANGIRIHSVSELDAVMISSGSIVQEWLDDCADALTYAILSAVGVLDLDAVVLDANLPTLLLRDLVDKISKRLQEARPAYAFTPKVLIGKVGCNAVAIGAASLPFYSNFSQDITIPLQKQSASSINRVAFDS